MVLNTKMGIVFNIKGEKKMLVYVNNGKQVKLNGNEVESVDVRIKKVVGRPFIPVQYVTAFSSPKIKVEAIVEIELNNVVVDEYAKKILVGYDMLNELEEIKALNKQELFELVRNNFEIEKDSLINMIVKFRIK